MKDQVHHTCNPSWLWELMNERVEGEEMNNGFAKPKGSCERKYGRLVFKEAPYLPWIYPFTSMFCNPFRTSNLKNKDISMEMFCQLLSVVIHNINIIGGYKIC